MGTTFIEDELLKRSSDGILTPMKSGDYMGLVDLIAGKIPTFSGWTNNPTDAADITDGDITTFCTTGNKVAAGAHQYAYFEWDLGGFYNIFCTAVGTSTVTAGNPYGFIFMWDGSAWISSRGDCTGTAVQLGHPFGGMCSKVRLGIKSSAAATITPNIREFHAWRL